MTLRNPPKVDRGRRRRCLRRGLRIEAALAQKLGRLDYGIICPGGPGTTNMESRLRNLTSAEIIYVNRSGQPVDEFVSYGHG